MSNNFLLTWISSDNPQLSSADHSKALDVLEQITDMSDFNFPDNDAIENLTDNFIIDFDDNGDLTLDHYTAASESILYDLYNTLDTDNHQSTQVERFTYNSNGVVRHLFLAGGMSYGDDPSEAFAAINNARYLPASVLGVLGLSVTDSPFL